MTARMQDSSITLRTYRVTGAGERQDMTETREYGGTLPADRPMFRNVHAFPPCKCPQHAE